MASKNDEAKLKISKARISELKLYWKKKERQQVRLAIWEAERQIHDKMIKKGFNDKQIKQILE